MTGGKIGIGRAIGSELKYADIADSTKTLHGNYSDNQVLSCQLIEATQAYLEQLKKIDTSKAKVSMEHVQGLDAYMKESVVDKLALEKSISNALEELDNARAVFYSELEEVNAKLSKTRRWNWFWFLTFASSASYYAGKVWMVF